MSILFYGLWSFITGAAIVVQTGLNGELRQNLGSPLLASLNNFAVGAVALLAAYLVGLAVHMETIPTLEAVKSTHWWMWVGGVIGAVYVLTGVIAPAKIGFSNFLCLIVAGQLVLSVAADHFGWFGAALHPVNMGRVAGILLIIGGVVVVQKN